MTVLRESVKAAIWNCLNHFAYADAIFLAERLSAEGGSDEGLLLLATAYYMSGKPKVASVLLDSHGILTPQCKLLHAQCYWDLRDYAKVEQIFTSGSSSNVAKMLHSSKKKSNTVIMINEIQKEFGDSACFALSLLGRAYLTTERPKLGELCLKASMKLNPLLWVPFEKMCDAGQNPDPQNLFISTNLCLSNFGKTHSFISKTATTTLEKTKILRECEPESNILRTRQLQNRAPKFSCDTPSPQHTKLGHGDKIHPGPHLINPTLMHLNCDLFTPPLSKESNDSRCNMDPLPSELSEKDSTTPAREMMRSTPSEDQWSKTIESIASNAQGSSHKFSKTQQKISRGLLTGPTSLSPITPSFGVIPLADTPSPGNECLVAMATPMDIIQQPNITAPVKKMVTRQSRKLQSGSQGGNPAFGKLQFSSENGNRCVSVTSDKKLVSGVSAHQQSMPPRRSTRSYSNVESAIKENNKHAVKIKHGQGSKRHNKPRQSLKIEGSISNSTNTIEANTNLDMQKIAHQFCTLESMMKYIRLIGQSYASLSRFECANALTQLNDLPHHHKNTGLVLSLMGKAHFELNDYNEAVCIFKKMRLLAPHFCYGLEIYSTALWHLQKDFELTHLAHDLKDLDHLCPQTWCAVGNCFSLQRDHSSAATFFQRAILLEPQFSYAHALLGHEKSSMEDFDGALFCYRNALKWNARLYSAWYGIGTIYYKQEKYKVAELHFRKSLEINPQNPVLLCHIGIVQHALNQTSSALETLDAAIKLGPRNPLCKYYHANVLIAMDKYIEAAKELKELKEIVPKESLVHFLLGKVYKKLKQNHLAVICFSWAMDLDPKGINNQIKEAIDRQHLLDDDHDTSDISRDGLAANISNLLSQDIDGRERLTHESYLHSSESVDDSIAIGSGSLGHY